MEQSKSYQIETNRKGRKILVMNKMVDIEKDESIGFDDFDAIFFNFRCLSLHEALFSLQGISPFYSEKCWIKPRFYKSQFNDNLDKVEYLVDGFAESYEDEAIMNRIEEIYDNIARLNLSYVKDKLQYSHISLCLRLCKYTLSRGIFDFTVTVVPGLSKGFTALFMALFDKLGVNTRMEILRFVQKLTTMNYIRKKRFVERLHLCPDCHSSHLLFIETCPKCHSSYLNEESVIHHFRCANVSPESTYRYDGELRCPKCKMFLRHIGVDYDRPTDIYFCHQCNNTFLSPAMKVYCSQCGKYYKTGELHPFDVWDYEFTEEGIQGVSNPNVKLKLAQDIWNGYVEYENYTDLLDWFLRTLLPDDSVIVLKIHLKDMDMNEDVLETFFQSVYIRFYYYNLTQKGSYIYMSQRCRRKLEGQNRQEMEENVHEYIFELIQHYDSRSTLEEEVFVYTYGDDVADFIKKID